MNNEVINAIKELQNRLNNVHGEDAMLETIDNYVAELKGELKKLKDLLWSEIKTILYSGDAERVLRVGDEKEFELYTGEKVKAKLISLNPHDVRADYSPATKAKATFMFYVDGEYEMNEECTNVGGWKDSKMRNAYMPRFYKLLPSDLQALILPVKKKTSAGGESEEIAETTDKLFLPSEIEVAGTTDCSCEGEGELYEYFKNSNMPYTWTWLRSPIPSSTYSFAYWNSNGYVNYSNAYNTSRVALCFCL